MPPWIFPFVPEAQRAAGGGEIPPWKWLKPLAVCISRRRAVINEFIWRDAERRGLFKGAAAGSYNIYKMFLLETF
ncbi:hypothetical protein [Nitrosomonas sp. PY1]|uniref:hypothetical protein n=1 Tax=Nitrosomonas sp. PY1 TaxID=1803906 RepID=UPI001FC8788C|nr:hypothetical protein [Nitrosomonas sp. PY1]